MAKKTDIDVHFVNSKEDCALRSGAKRYADSNNYKIVIMEAMSVNHQLKTMIHEYTHIFLYKDNVIPRK